MTTVEDRTKAKPAAPPGTKLSAANKGKVDPMEVQPGEKEVFVKFEDVFPDFDWNMRSQANVLADSDADSGGGLKDLAASMATRGQLMALILRPNVHKKGPKLNHNRDGSSYVPYELVAGFRRFVAGASLNGDDKNQEHSKKTGVPIIPGVPNGTMRCVVRNYDDLQAKLTNGAENAHNPVEPPDLMAHIVTLNRPPYTMSVGEIAENEGYSLATVHRYANIGNAIIPEVFAHWRLGGTFEGTAVGRRVSLEEIEEVSKKPKGEQAAAYKALLTLKGKEAESKDWFVAAGKAAVRQGVFLAQLEKEGIITLTSKPWAECAAHLVKMPAKAGAKAKEAIGRKIEESYQAEMKKTGGEKDSG